MFSSFITPVGLMQAVYGCSCSFE